LISSKAKFSKAGCVKQIKKFGFKEYMKTIPFTKASKKIKCLGVNLTKDVNNLYKENCKLLKKD
jgi:hypothetical protein